MEHIVVIEPDALVRTLLERRLRKEDWRVSSFRDGVGAREHLARDPAHLILVDMGLPGMDGLAVVEELRHLGITAPILVLSAFDAPHLYAAVRGTGGSGLVHKPYDPEELVRTVRRLLAA